VKAASDNDPFSSAGFHNYWPYLLWCGKCFQQQRPNNQIWASISTDSWQTRQNWHLAHHQIGQSLKKLQLFFIWKSTLIFLSENLSSTVEDFDILEYTNFFSLCVQIFRRCQNQLKCMHEVCKTHYCQLSNSEHLNELYTWNCKSNQYLLYWSWFLHHATS